MPCYHPLHAVRTNTIVDGKRKIVFMKEAADESSLLKGEEALLLPCGNCLGCRLEYSRQWAVRCALEASQHKHNYFVTLTYNDEYLPRDECMRIDKKTGEVTEFFSTPLRPEHLTAFMKRLRKHIKHKYGVDGVRFFACGEYGSKKQRPHYHLILFNCPLELQFYRNSDGYTYYNSPDIAFAWSEQRKGEKCRREFGFNVVTEFSFKTAAYVARYMLKKHKGLDRDWYEENGLVPEFTRCSRRPGLGRAYFDSNVNKIYDFDSITIPQLNGSLTCKPPKYYDRILNDKYPEIVEALKDIRSSWLEIENEKVMMCTDLDEDEYRVVCEQNKALSVQSLVRNL